MREIKFRAWLNDEQRMIPWSRLWLEVEDGYGGVFEQGGRRNTTSDFELMQYTGLRDKNGTEIYEGDICIGGTLWATGGFHIDNDIATTVTFSDGIFKLGKISLMSYARHCKVIGNIYENADLLSGESDEH